MSWLEDLLTFPVTGPIKGLMFLAERIAEQVDAELLDETKVEQELLALAFALENGELDEAAYLERETELLERLEAIRAFKEGQACTTSTASSSESPQTD